MDHLLSVLSHCLYSSLSTVSRQPWMTGLAIAVLTLCCAFLYLFLRWRSVVSSSEAQKMLLGMLDGKQEYLSNEGAIKSIGEQLGAADVMLFLLMPGRNKKQVALFRWSGRAPTPPAIKPPVLLLQDVPMAEQIIQRGEIMIGSARFRKFAQPSRDPGAGGRETPSIAVPIQFRGAIIGGLYVEWDTRIRLAKTVVKQITQMAELIPPIAQMHREIAALDQLSFRLTGWHAGRLTIENNHEALRGVAFILQDTLSPLATAVNFNFGFEARGCLRTDCDDDIVEQSEIADEDLRTKFEVGVGGKQHEIIHGNLYIRSPNDDSGPTRKFLIGSLAFLVPAEKDDLMRPTLVRQYLHRRAVRALAADILFEISRQQLNQVHKIFSVRLNNEKVTTVGEWFYEVWRAAKGAGLVWIVATEATAGGPWLGSQLRLKVVERLGESLREKEMEDLSAISLDPTEGDTRHVIRLYLPESKCCLWMGVGRKGFGEELEFPSPWKMFLERFGEAADASLSRLRTTLEFQQLQIETAQAQGLAKVGVMTGALRHQITNMIRDLAGPISTLDDARKIGRLDVDRVGEAIVSMRETSEELLELSTTMMSVAGAEAHAPCSLLEAAQMSQRLFAVALDQGKISLEIFIGSEIEIDMPFQVASLAIATLVENAKDALNAYRSEPPQAMPWDTQYSMNGFQNGDHAFSEAEKSSIKTTLKQIRIEAVDAGEMIHCHVMDNGPGVPPHLRERVFLAGETSKQGNGGWGLYLVKHSLQLNRGTIDLTRNSPDGAQFTIRFPKPRLEL